MYGSLPEGFGQVSITKYSPIEYGNLATWGKGHRLKKLLAMVSSVQFQHLRIYQDRRNDTGHAEIVTLFGSHLARLVGFPEEDRQIVELACSFHDAGYSQMENINERFRAAWADFVTSGCRSEREHKQLWDLRVEHQWHAMMMVDEKMGMFPRKGEVMRIVGDHDTRIYPPDRLSAVMQDADMLWRVTLLYLQRWETAESVLAPGYYDKQLARLRLHLPISKKIAEIELARSLEMYCGKELVAA